MFGILISFALLVVGEGINVWAEVMSAKLPNTYALLEPKNIFLYVMVCIGCAFLLFGYAIGYQSSKDIWTVTVSSIVAILLVEPFIAYSFFHELPEKGALAGMVLGIIAFLVTILWR